MIRTRFAPSPTGPLHLGHAYSAIIAHDFAKANGGEFIVRIEDLDQSRVRKKWDSQIFEDLEWLGLSWARPIMRQSERAEAYSNALDTLYYSRVIYPCYCTRRDISESIAAPQGGSQILRGPDGIIYPGTCRHKTRTKTRPKDQALRLDVASAMITNDLNELKFIEILAPGHTETININKNSNLIDIIGDIVIMRRDMAPAYHLAVVIDDMEQNITHVVRGEDLRPSTSIHVVLQRLLGLTTPFYVHHPLINDENGKRLAKRNDAKSISKFRSQGASPLDIRNMIGL